MDTDIEVGARAVGDQGPAAGKSVEGVVLADHHHSGARGSRD